jgi:hypothetical protein
MTKLSFFTGLIMLTIVFGCAEDRSAVENLEKEVFAIHDEVMPKMDDIMQLKSQLSNELSAIDSLTTISSNAVLLARKDSVLNLSTALEKADAGMMDWMHNYNGDSLQKLPVADAIKYLEAEKIKIESVKQQTLGTITKAQQFLKQ